MTKGSQWHELHQLVNEHLCLLIEAIEITKETVWIGGANTETFRSFFSSGNSFAVSAVKSKMMNLSDIKCNVKDISV